MAVINEIRISSGGSSDDTSNFVELHGAPFESLAGLSLVVVSGEFEPGQVDFAIDISSGSMDENGIFLLSNPAAYANDSGDVTADFDFFGSPTTFLLVEGFSGAAGADLDAGNDGAFDSTPWTRIVDQLSLTDGDDTPDVNYATPVLGPDGDFAPAAVARSEDGTGAFELVAFGDTALDTPGESNVATGPASAFTLELLHAADQEAGSAAIVDAPNFSAVLNALRAQDLGADGAPDNTITLSSGDAFIPGIFYDTSEAVFGSAGIADIQIQNELGFEAIALGNHEFDFGTEVLASLIDGSAEGTILGADFTGTDFPYLSTNLDFSTDSALAGLETAGGQAPQGNVLSASTVLDVNGEQIGVVGATTPTLAAISSPGDVGIQPVWAGTTPTPAELDALATEIQAEVDALLADNPAMNKVVLLAHMQQLQIEQGLATRLENVDIIVGGGSNTRLLDSDDRLRDGDSNQGAYPQFFTNAGGTDTVLVNTDGSYKYVGRLVIDFDADGNIIRDSYDATISGAYATDAQGVTDLGAEGLIDPEIQQIVDAIEAEIIATESNVFGFSDVFLNGNRSGTGAADDGDGVRTQETNLGNLTADANLVAAQAIDPSVVVSIKNGGGIRASIGETVVPAAASEAERTPNSELVDGDGTVIKPEGGISQNDIQTTLAFNNGLTLLTLTREELVEVLEHGVGALPGVSGRFPQVSGVEFSFDDTQPEGARIVDAAIVDADGTVIAELMSGGEMVGAPTEEFRIVTLDFLAAPRFDDDGNYTGGGDGYPWPNTNTDPARGEVGPDAARINPVALEQEGVRTGDATFADDGSEQDALAEYLDDVHGTPETAFAQADVGAGADQRIENLNAPDLDTDFLSENTADLRVATYNASLNRSAEGELITDLSTGDDAQARSVAEIIQKADADIILINEFDFDAAGTAADLFRTNYLEVSQNGEAPVEYPYVYVAPSNTGVATGFDLDNNGSVGGGNDAQGFGFFEGQFGFAIFSKHPIDEDNIRSFQTFLWKDMPGARLPADPADADGNGDTDNWYTSEELDVLRLSSKNHVDVPVIVDGEVVHVLAAHPTPPVFDGPEDRNGLRNADEIRFWADYVDPTKSDYIYDDAGQTGGLGAGERFVIVGDYNADPFDGDSVDSAALQLLDNPFIDGSADDAPSSAGAVEAAFEQAGVNTTHQGDPAFDTADFGFAGAGNPDGTPGNLRVDYVLPSVAGLEQVNGQVFWPDAATFPEDAALAGFPTSDHRLVAVDMNITPVTPEGTGEIALTRIASFDSGVGEGGSEVVAFDAGSAKMLTTNGEADRIDVVDLSDPAAPVLLGSVALADSVSDYDGVQSVAVTGNLGAVAVAREDDNGPLPGVVVFFDVTTFAITSTVEVGFLPDMLTFTPDGTKVLTANEGEPGDAGDVPGGVSIVDVATGTVTSVGFDALDPMADQLRADGLRLFPTAPVPANSPLAAMANGVNGFDTATVLTIGETVAGTTGALNPSTAGDYTPPGVLDGLGAFELDANTVRVLGNHELLNTRGNAYEVSDGAGGTFTMTGARISYFDIDKTTKQVVDAGLAYNTVYDANGSVASDITFLGEPTNGFADFAPGSGVQLQGFSRFCSGMLVEAGQFGEGRGLESTIYFAGEEDGGFFNSIGGAQWALDPATGDIWQVPAMGRGAWENVTEIDTGTTSHVAFILADDSAPFDFDGDGADEAAPLFLYVGEKNANGDFLEQNGLRDGKLFVWVANDGAATPLDFRGTGETRDGAWVEVDNSRNLAEASQDGLTGFDEYGYPTQGNLWLQAKDLGAFGFSRPEDVATNPANGAEVVLASTGVDTFAVDPATGDGADTFGTIYTIETAFNANGYPIAGAVRIAYDGDEDTSRALRSPDNLDWADDGLIYIQEDEAEEDSLTGEPLFGDGAANPNEASIVRLDPATGAITRVAEIDRSVVLDPTTAGTPVDTDAGRAGEWESSGILDVSTLFGEDPGSLFLYTVQAHGIEDQEAVNADSRISDDDLVEGGQLLFLQNTTANPSLDLEPEYITLSADGAIAYVGLQEANAIAVLDVATGTFTGVMPLGTTDHSLPGNALDTSDRDDAINITNRPVFGLHMPDAIASYEVGGKTYIVTANEGDARDEDDRIKDLDLDPVAFPNADALQEDEVLGRLQVSTIDGDTDGDGDLDALFAYGSRSFSIFDADTGEKVFDSGADFERIIADLRPANAFNNQDFRSDDADVLDEDRSDNKGPEPEAVAVGQIGDAIFAFIGLERDNGIMVYNVTDPANAEFVQYINSADQGDISPETLAFVAAEDSPSGRPLLLAANEVSGTTAIYEVDVNPLPASMPNGVASGEITTSSALLWTRSTVPGDVVFEVSTDADFSTIVATQTATVSDPDVPVKVTVSGLSPDTDYFYRATDASGADLIGSFGTAAAAGTQAGLSFGVTGDWRGDLAPYVAVSNAAEAGLDFMVLEGDNIYADYASPDLPQPQAETLGDFRIKYQEILGERLGENFWADLRENTPVFVSIDDHEVTNDFAGGADAGSDDRFAETSGFINDTVLYENGLQVFQEYNPLEPRTYGDTGDDRTAGEIDLYRAQDFGSDASIFVLDNRSFRDAQLPDPTGGSQEVVAQFVTDSLTQDRTMLGDAQLERLKADLLAAEEAGQTWKFVMNAEPIQNLGPVGPADRYEGYARERTELLKFIEDNDIDNVVFVAADVHATFINNLTYQEVPFGEQIATSIFEVTTGSVAFDPAFGQSVVDGAAALGLLTPEEVAFYDSLPVLPDNDGQLNDKDDFLSAAINDIALQPLGYDPLGLDNNLAQADGLIDAQLLQGGWVSAHTYGWTQFDIDETTQALTVTTYGIDTYGAEDLETMPEDVLSREPRIVSQFVVNAQPNSLSISEVQGAGHRSPFEGQAVAVEGIVTAIDPGEGYWVQDPDGDGDAATSDAIFIDDQNTDAVQTGDRVEVNGTVDERQFGADLSTTTLDDVTSVQVLESGVALPQAIVIGGDGLLPPTGQIDDDGLTQFDPQTDGIDFFEALEGMRVTLADGAEVIGSNRFGETFVTVLSDSGARTDNGGLLLGGANGSITDANPERILIDDDIYADSGRGDAAEAVPAATTGDTLTGVTGVIDYSFGEFKLLAETAPTVVPGDTARDRTHLTSTEAGDLTVATYNVLNLDPGDDPSKVATLAQDIVSGLTSPDIIGLQEIQDNDGPTDSGTVAADVTYQLLIDAIVAAGGPTYAFADSTPADKTDGGQPGANIRVGFLYNPDEVSLVSTQRIEGDLDPNGAFDEDPTPGDGVNEGYEGTRKPLAGLFEVDGEQVHVIVNHFKSKSGDDPLSGSVQPPVQVTRDQRVAQAEVVNDYAEGILETDPEANVIVLGDMNDFAFSDPLAALAGDDLTNLMDALPDGDRYTFNFNGNSQTLDHILVSDALLPSAEVDAVHINADFPSGTVASDHDPVVAKVNLNAASGTQVAGSEGGTLIGSALVDRLEGGAGSDVIVPGAGPDTLLLTGGGTDLVRDDAAGLNGDIVIGFGSDDKIVVTGSRLSQSDIGFDAETGILSLGETSMTVVGGDLENGVFMVTRDATGSTVQFVETRADLANKQAVDMALINGIEPAEFLAGVNSGAFAVTLETADSGFSNGLGYFTRDLDTGAIGDVGILFANAKAAAAGSMASITGVDDDEELVFFLAQDGAEALEAVSGTLGIEQQDGVFVLTEDGAAIDVLIFNSADADRNADGLQHALSGIAEDGTGLRVGFEDLLGGGDNDYQDVTFLVSAVDDTPLV